MAFPGHTHSLFSSLYFSMIGHSFPHSNSHTREIFTKCTYIVSYVFDMTCIKTNTFVFLVHQEKPRVNAKENHYVTYD